MAAVGIGGFHGGVFATMKFPPYKFQEYPKRITKPDGTRVRVLDQADELRVKAEIPEARPQTEIERERDDIVVQRDQLANVVASKDAELARLREDMAKLQAATVPKVIGHATPEAAAEAAGIAIPAVAPIGPSKPTTGVTLGVKKSG